MDKVTIQIEWQRYGHGYIGHWVRSDGIRGTASFEVSPQGGLTGGWNWSFAHNGHTVRGGAHTEDKAKAMCEAAYRGIFESEIIGDGRWDNIEISSNHITFKRDNLKMIISRYSGDCNLYRDRELLDKTIIDTHQDNDGMIRDAADWAQRIIDGASSSPKREVESILFPVRYLSEIENNLMSEGKDGMALVIRSVLDESFMLKAKPIGWAENEHKVIMPLWDESNPRRHKPIGDLLNEGKKDG